jgi:hypothetical protein
MWNWVFDELPFRNRSQLSSSAVLELPDVELLELLDAEPVDDDVATPPRPATRASDESAEWVAVANERRALSSDSSRCASDASPRADDRPSSDALDALDALDDVETGARAEADCVTACAAR